MSKPEQVRVYVLVYPNGTEVFCVTDEKNIVLYPEYDREHDLMEYGHHGVVNNSFDYHQEPAFLEVGDKALIRPVKHLDSFDVWPAPDHVPTVKSRALAEKQTFISIQKTFHENVRAYKAARNDILRETAEVIDSFRKAQQAEQKKKLKKLGEEPLLANMLRSKLNG